MITIANAGTTGAEVEELGGLISRSDSIILLLLVAIVLALLALRPVLKMWIEAKEKAEKAEREHTLAMKQEDKVLYQELVTVVKSNVEVNAALKTVIESQYSHCDTCRADQMVILNRVFSGINSIEDALRSVEKRHPAS